MGKQCQTLFLGGPKSLQMVTAAMKLKDAYSLEVVTLFKTALINELGNANMYQVVSIKMT